MHTNRGPRGMTAVPFNVVQDVLRAHAETSEERVRLTPLDWAVTLKYGFGCKCILDPLAVLPEALAVRQVVQHAVPSHPTSALGPVE